MARASDSGRAATALPHLLLGAGVLTLAALSLWQASEIPAAVLQVAVGPAVAPWFVTAFLAACGLGLVVAALRGGWARDQDGTITEWGSLGLVALGLFVNVALIEQAGFIIASTCMFTLVARGFGSRAPLRDAAIGGALALISYLLFDRLLGYKIGSGLIESLL